MPDTGIITTGSHPKALWPGVKRWFGVGYGEHSEEYRVLFDIINSSQNYEEDVQANPFGLVPQKNEGTGVTYTGQTQGWTKRYVHIAYSLGFIVTYEEMKDNLYEKLANSRAKALGFAFRQTKETVAANVYNRAFNASYTGGDGSALCVSTHSTRVGSQSNIITAADISEQAIEDMITAIMGATDERGNKIMLMPQTLLVARQDWFEANRILKSVLQNDTANNATNVLKATNALPGGISMNHFFTDADAWFIKTNCPDGMTMFQRDSYPLKRDNDFDTDNAKAKAYDRYSVGWTDWRGVYGSAGA